MKNHFLAGVAFAAMAIAAPASAALNTIGFDGGQAGYSPTYGVRQEVSNQFGSMGVLFQDQSSPGRGAIVGVCGPSQGGLALFGYGADFNYCGDTTPNLDIVFVDPTNNANSGYTTFFSIYNFDGLIQARAYDVNNILLGTTSNSSGTLTFSGVGNISRVNLLSLDQDPTTLDTLQFEDVVGIGGGGGIPEPATWAMMLLGFFSLGSSLRSRRRMALSA